MGVARSACLQPVNYVAPQGPECGRDNESPSSENISQRECQACCRNFASHVLSTRELPKDSELGRKATLNLNPYSPKL